MLLFGITIFLGAFLLFQIQPLIAKFILPWFGGGPGVWTTCMVFFQVTLLAGYAYAHFSVRRLKLKTQVLAHVFLVAFAVGLLPIIPGPQWKPGAGAEPVTGILKLLTVCIGLQFFVLSATGPLLQHWFQTAAPGRSPYRLYAVSNAGSLLALLSFPFVIEPHVTRQMAAQAWGAGLVLYLIGCGVCGWLYLRRADGIQTSTDLPAPPQSEPKITFLQRLLWLLLAATGTTLLLATTNKLCQDVAVIPFLWIVPLSIYLLTFILCFESSRFYNRVLMILVMGMAFGILIWTLKTGAGWALKYQLLIFCGGLFFACMVCHGELYRLRPGAASLTSFYLHIALGGALGGIFVGVIAPLTFSNFYELHLGMFACALLVFVVCAIEGTRFLPLNEKPIKWLWLALAFPLLLCAALDISLTRFSTDSPLASRNTIRVLLWGFATAWLASWFFRVRRQPAITFRITACLWLFLGVCALGSALWLQARNVDPDRLETMRNFYGVLNVYDHRRDKLLERYSLLQHGRITHGLQFADAAQASWPTTYYGRDSGVGLALDSLGSTNRHIGLVGLGSGTLAAYGRFGDRLRIYEINPAVVRLANERFTFLRDCAAKIEIVPGDARLSMEHERSQAFDLLALDAFSGDAIPAHLLTREAFQIYLRHLKRDGVIAVHISNHYLDLAPVVLSLAREFGLESAVIDYNEKPEQWWLYACTWVLLTRDATFLDDPFIAAASCVQPDPGRTALWTDDFISLFPILK